MRKISRRLEGVKKVCTGFKILVFDMSYLIRLYHFLKVTIFFKVVGDLGIEPSVRLREGVTVPCHTLRPVAHCSFEKSVSACLQSAFSGVNRKL